MSQDKTLQASNDNKTSRKRRGKDQGQRIQEYLFKSGSPEEILFKINEILYSQKADETRKNVRAPLSVPVEFKVNGKVYTGTTYTLSKEGVFIKFPHPPPEGTAIELELDLPDDGDVIRVSGEVVRSLPYERAAGEANILGMSVVFNKIEAGSRRRIDKLVKARARRMQKGVR